MRAITAKEAAIVNWSIFLGFPASGVFAEDKEQWYRGFGYLFCLVFAFDFGIAILLNLFCRKFGSRIQTYNDKPPKYFQEFLETARCIWCVAGITAWPYYRFQKGLLQSFVWDIEESTAGSSIVGNLIYIVIMFLVIDITSFWKHKLLHTKTFYIFHSQHHQFTDPTPIGAFAVSPFEALLTFGLILFDCLPQANMIKFYWPLHSSILFSIAILNLYLHAGYTIPFVEATLPKLMINTSGFHNVHHAKGNRHFSELLTLWDYLLGTGDTYYGKRKVAEAEPAKEPAK